MVHRGFRYLGIAEGVSFLLLLGIAMPLKYLWGEAAMVRIVGMAHGVLFLGYVLFAFLLSDREEWPTKKLLLALAASVLPLGTFLFDWKFLRKAAVQ